MEMKEACVLGVYPSMYTGGWIFSHQANVLAFTLNSINGTVQHIVETSNSLLFGEAFNICIEAYSAEKLAWV